MKIKMSSLCRIKFVGSSFFFFSCNLVLRIRLDYVCLISSWLRMNDIKRYIFLFLFFVLLTANGWFGWLSRVYVYV